MAGPQKSAAGFPVNALLGTLPFPLVILALYHFSLAWFLGWWMPAEKGFVTLAYAGSAGMFLLACALALYVALLVRRRITGDPTGPGHHRTADPVGFGDLVLVLVPMTPIVRYVLNNQDILSGQGSLFVAAVFLLFFLLIVVVIPALLGAVTSSGLLMLGGLAFSFVIADMASLSASRNWYQQGDLFFLLALFGGMLLAGFVLRRWGGNRFLRAAAVLFFVANTAAQLARREPEPEPVVPEERISVLADLVGDRAPIHTPDIHLLVYDAYVGNETMRGYGIDNSGQENYLTSRGFTLYPGTYSLAGATISSMSRVLNNANSYYDKPRTGVSGDGIVHNLLADFGYANVGIFYNDYFFRGIEPAYDHSYPGLKATHKLVVKAVFMGEFRFDVEIDNPPYEDFARQKAEVLRDRSQSPRFVYIHDELPGHSQNSGRCLPEEAELFRERLERANEAMKQDVATILERDPGAIIIIAGDHGPYLTKNCDETGGHFELAEISRLDIQDRLGTFLAIRWPGGEAAPQEDIDILQHIFPAVFAYMFEDEDFLEARIATRTVSASAVSGAVVQDGVIQGGLHDGEPLFLGR